MCGGKRIAQFLSMSTDGQLHGKIREEGRGRERRERERGERERARRQLRPKNLHAICNNFTTGQPHTCRFTRTEMC